MKKKGRLWVVEEKTLAKLNPFYGWGWGTDKERRVLDNLSKYWAKKRVAHHLLKSGRKETWWTVESLKNSLRREWMGAVAQKKHAYWDIATRKYWVRQKGGDSIPLEF